MKCKNPDCETGHVRTGTCDWYGFPHMQKCPNCNGTGKQPEDTQHDSSDEIREAFEKEGYVYEMFKYSLDGNRYVFKETTYITANTSEMLKDVNREYSVYVKAWESATAKAQAEIEELKEDIETELKMKSVYISENLKLDSRIKELEQTAITMAEVSQDTLDKLKKQYKTEEHKCCGHCKRESDK